EGTEAFGDMFQVSNQITLGKTEEEIVVDLESVVRNLIEQERVARKYLVDRSKIVLEDQVQRSLGILKHSRMMESHEAAVRLSKVLLGIDLGMIDHVTHLTVNELMILIHPCFLQYYAEKTLTSKQREELRSTLIRERLLLEEK